MKPKLVSYQDIAADLLILNHDSAYANFISAEDEWRKWYDIKHNTNEVKPNILAVASYLTPLLVRAVDDSASIPYGVEALVAEDEIDYSEKLIATSSLVALARLLRTSPIMQGEGIEFSDDASESDGVDHFMDMSEALTGDMAFGLVVPSSEFEPFYLDKSGSQTEVSDGSWYHSADIGLYVKVRKPALISQGVKDYLYFGSKEFDRDLFLLTIGDEIPSRAEISAGRGFDANTSLRLQPYLSFSHFVAA